MLARDRPAEAAVTKHKHDSSRIPPNSRRGPTCLVWVDVVEVVGTDIVEVFLFEQMQGVAGLATVVEDFGVRRQEQDTFPLCDMEDVKHPGVTDAQSCNIAPVRPDGASKGSNLTPVLGNR